TASRKLSNALLSVARDKPPALAISAILLKRESSDLNSQNNDSARQPSAVSCARSSFAALLARALDIQQNRRQRASRLAHRNRLFFRALLRLCRSHRNQNR